MQEKQVRAYMAAARVRDAAKIVDSDIDSEAGVISSVEDKTRIPEYRALKREYLRLAAEAKSSGAWDFTIDLGEMKKEIAEKEKEVAVARAEVERHAKMGQIVDSDLSSIDAEISIKPEAELPDGGMAAKNAYVAAKAHYLAAVLLLEAMRAQIERAKQEVKLESQKR